MSRMTSDEIMAMIDAESQMRTDAVRSMLVDLGATDALAEFDKNMREIRLGTSHARNIWHSISPAQRRVIQILATGRHLRRAPCSRTRFDAVGEPHAVGGVCGVATVRALASRELLEWQGGAFDPEGKAALTEHAYFVLKHGPTPSGIEDV